MSHDRQMALGLRAAEQAGHLSACLAWITLVEFEERGYARKDSFTASHWWGLDGRKLAWEPQPVQDCYQYMQDIFVQVHSTEHAGLSFNRVTCCSAKTFAEDPDCQFSVLHIRLLHNCACWRQNAVAVHDACKLFNLTRPSLVPCCTLCDLFATHVALCGRLPLQAYRDCHLMCASSVICASFMQARLHLLPSLRLHIALAHGCRVNTGSISLNLIEKRDTGVLTWEVKMAAMMINSDYKSKVSEQLYATLLLPSRSHGH